ncbi:MAG: ATP-binding protein [Dehalococcoidales bacterium]|nr:ATP-binding protein [Dehalococcoidales bacterium]
MREPFRKFIETELGSGFLLIACGLPCTVKTGTTREVSRIKGYPILRTDIIRKKMLKNEDIFDEKVASNMDKRKLVYDEMFRQADETLEKGSEVILDATFVTQSLRKQAAAIAAKYNRRLVILQTDCPQEIAIRRIRERSREDYVSNALTEQAYLNNQKQFEAVDLGDLKNSYPNLSILHLIVDTRDDLPQDWYITGSVKE